jgi:hypothetical protein
MAFNSTLAFTNEMIKMRANLDHYTSELSSMGLQLTRLQALHYGYDNLMIKFTYGEKHNKWALETTRLNRSNNLEQLNHLKQRMNRRVHLCTDIEARIKKLESQETQLKKLETLTYNQTSKNCTICTEQVLRLIPCGVCKFTVCPRCYKRILENNRGVSKCPQCRAESNNVLSD